MQQVTPLTPCYCQVQRSGDNHTIKRTPYYSPSQLSHSGFNSHSNQIPFKRILADWRGAVPPGSSTSGSTLSEGDGPAGYLWALNIHENRPLWLCFGMSTRLKVRLNRADHEQDVSLEILVGHETPFRWTVWTRAWVSPRYQRILVARNTFGGLPLPFPGVIVSLNLVREHTMACSW